MPKKQRNMQVYTEITLDDWIASTQLESTILPPEQDPLQTMRPSPAKPCMVLPNGETATPRRCETECIKLFEKLGRVHGKWEVFSSFIKMLAIALSNQVDFAHFKEREAEYLEEASKYTKEEMKGFTDLTSILEMAFELSKDAPCDILGPMFHEMELHNQWHGQFFSPQNICDMMAMITVGTSPVDMEKGYFTVCEPSCGSGAMLMGVAKVIRSQGLTPACMIAFATDIDIRCVYMCYIQLCMYGIPARVTHGNTITMEQWSHWYTPEFIMGDWNNRLRADEEAEQKRKKDMIMEMNQIAIAVMEQMKAMTTARLFSQGVVLQSLEGEYLHTLSMEQMDQIKQLEANGALVYHVISGQYLVCGARMKMDTYLLIPKEDAQAYSEQAMPGNIARKMEDQATSTWEVFGFVNNLSSPDNSKYGYCQVKANGNAGLSRVA